MSTVLSDKGFVTLHNQFWYPHFCALQHSQVQDLYRLHYIKQYSLVQDALQPVNGEQQYID